MQPLGYLVLVWPWEQFEFHTLELRSFEKSFMFITSH